MVYLDTHIVVWLYAGRTDMLSTRAVAGIEENDLFISPMVLLELAYLHEIKRVDATATRVISALSREIGLQTCDRPFPAIASAAIAENWTRDPFDRIIVAQARIAKARLISCDRVIQSHYPATLW
ncbi:MAG: type II toxin-antitoxin system VapC family toxin [Tepidisphaerales bacterium]